MKKKLLIGFISCFLGLSTVAAISNNAGTISKADGGNTETDITKVEIFNNNYLMFTLSAANDYPSETVTSETTSAKIVHHLLASSNLNSKVELNGSTNQFQDYTVIDSNRVGTTMISSYWTNPPTTIKVLSGAQFTKYAYLSGASETNEYYYTTEDIIFTYKNGGYVRQYDVTYIDFEIEKIIAPGDNFLEVYPTVHDYPETANTVFLTNSNDIKTRLENSTGGAWRNATFDDVERTAPETAIINLWSDKGCFAYYAVPSGDGGIASIKNTIVFPAGYCLPSYEYCVNGTGEMRCYRLAKSVTFEKHEGTWYKEGTYVAPVYNETTVTDLVTYSESVPISGTERRDNYTWIHFVLNDYDGLSTPLTLSGGAMSIAAASNQNEYVLINGENVTYQTYAFMVGYSNNDKIYSIRADGYNPEGFTSVTIKAGFLIPAYSYLTGGDTVFYKISKTITFYGYNCWLGGEEYKAYTACYTTDQEYATGISSARAVVRDFDTSAYRDDDAALIKEKQTYYLNRISTINFYTANGVDVVNGFKQEFLDYVATFLTKARWDELGVYAETKINEVNNSIDYSKYDEESQTLISSYISTALVEAKQLDSEAKIDEYVEQLKEKIEAVATIEEIAALADKIASATEEIRAYKADVVYREEEAEQRTEIIETAVAAIENARSIVQIDELVAQAKADIDELKTEEDYLKEEIQPAIEEALERLENYLDDIDSSKYTEENYQIIVNLVEQAKVDVQKCLHESEIEAIFTKLAEDIENVEKIEEDLPPVPDEPEEETSSKGCGGNMQAMSIIICSLAVAGIALLILKRKHQ